MKKDLGGFQQNKYYPEVNIKHCGLYLSEQSDSAIYGMT